MMQPHFTDISMPPSASDSGTAFSWWTRPKLQVIGCVGDQAFTRRR